MALFRPIITSINNLNSISFKGTYELSSDTFTIENNDRYHDSITFCSVLDSYIMCDFSNYLEGDVVADFYCDIPVNIFSNTSAMVTLYATIGVSDFTLYIDCYIAEILESTKNKYPTNYVCETFPTGKDTTI